MNIYQTKHTTKKAGTCKHGISNVITTIILTGVLLIIFTIAMFVSTNILSAQMVSTEFKQAQSNMLLLDSKIQDVSLRPGAGSYVQFNERSGGIGMLTTPNTLSITVQNSNHQITFNNLLQLIYRGGYQASAPVDSSTGYTDLRGNPNTTYVNLTQGLGLLRLAQDSGAKIKLDYDRVRIVSTGLIDAQGTNLVQVTFIHLLKGEIYSASGTVNTMVQNTATIPTIWTFETSTVSITIQYTTPSTQVTQTWPPQGWTPPVGTARTVVIFSEIQVKISIK